MYKKEPKLDIVEVFAEKIWGMTAEQCDRVMEMLSYMFLCELSGNPVNVDYAAAILRGEVA